MTKRKCDCCDGTGTHHVCEEVEGQKTKPCKFCDGTGIWRPATPIILDDNVFSIASYFEEYSPCADILFAGK